MTPEERACCYFDSKGELRYSFERVPSYLRNLFGFTHADIAIYCALWARRTRETVEVPFFGKIQRMKPGSVHIKRLDDFAKELANEGIPMNRWKLQRLLRKWAFQGLIRVVTSRKRGSSGTVVQFNDESKIPRLFVLQQMASHIKTSSSNEENSEVTGDCTDKITDSNSKCTSMHKKMHIKISAQLREEFAKIIVATQFDAHQTPHLRVLRLKDWFLRAKLERVESRIGLHNIYIPTKNSRLSSKLDKISGTTADTDRKATATHVPDYLAGVRVDDDYGGTEYNKQVRRENRLLRYLSELTDRMRKHFAHAEILEESKRRQQLRNSGYTIEQVARIAYEAELELGEGTWTVTPLKLALQRLPEFIERAEARKNFERRDQLRAEITALQQKLAELEGRLPREGEPSNVDAVQTHPGSPLTNDRRVGKG